jgi:HK97 family phage major capsid protein
MSKTIAEQVAALEAARAAKTAAMEEALGKSIEEGRSTSDSERDSFDELQREVETIDDDLKRLRALEKIMASKAVALPAQPKTIEAGSAARDPERHPAPQIRVTPPQLPPGIRFARMVKCLGVAQGSRDAAVRIAERRYPDDTELIAVMRAAADLGEMSDLVTKVAVSGGTTLDPVWASPLVPTTGGGFADFLEFLRPMTILGKFGAGGIPALRSVPFRTRLVSQTTGGAGYWVGEGDAKPLTKFDFASTYLTPLKVANIAVVTEELLRDSSPSADALVRDSLAAALRERLDIDFIDPAKAAVANVSPASITNGLTPIQSTGGTAAQIRTDVAALLGQFVAANNPPSTGVWVMKSLTALRLSMMTNALGEPEDFGGQLTMAGGSFFGMPVITSDYLPASGSPTGDYVVIVNASDIWIADEGGLSVDMSREASLEMDSAPSSKVGGGDTDSPSEAPTGASLVSMFQTNSVAFRAERTINWARRRASGVQVLWGVNWGE